MKITQLLRRTPVDSHLSTKKAVGSEFQSRNDEKNERDDLVPRFLYIGPRKKAFLWSSVSNSRRLSKVNI
jgi:hypothetical protein